jgi:hypothetical protein
LRGHESLRRLRESGSLADEDLHLEKTVSLGTASPEGENNV